MLSVGIYTYSTRPRGSVVHAAALAEALVASGQDATLYALAKPGAPFYRPLSCPVVLFAAREAPPGVDALVRQRVDELRAGLEAARATHDVYHAQDCLAANALLSREARGHAPLARTVHHVERFESPYLAQCQARSILEADEVLSVSRHTQASVLEEFGRPSALVPNGVDPRRFAAVSKDAARQWRARVGAADGDVLVLSVGGVEPRKNTRLGLAAFARAVERCPSLRWLIVGAHGIWDHVDYQAAFDSDLRRLPARTRERVVRLGSVAEDDLTSLYGLTDLLLCVSREEGFGLCVLEALAAGAAVIVPDRPPFTEYVDATCGRLVDGASAANVADALAVLGTKPDLRARLALSGRRRAALWPWSRSAAEHLALYRSLCDTAAAVS